MKRILAALLAGLVFGLGLVISKMIDPAKVLGFLDLAGNWDASLAFVMLGAIPVAAIGYRIGRAWRAPAFDRQFHNPPRTEPDRRLVVGALIFGAGWGLAGYCPGPALASLALGHKETWIFVAAMLAGMVCQRLLTEFLTQPTRRTAAKLN